MDDIYRDLLVEENKTRIKITQIQILIRQARQLRGHEKELIMDRALKIATELQKDQDKRIHSILEEMKQGDSKKLTIRAKKLVKRQSKKTSEQSDLETPSRDIFSENPFQNILDQAQDILNQNLDAQNDLAENEDQEEREERANLLLEHLYKAKALLDLTEMESEVDISKKEFMCIVHKGPIEGGAYICPHCKALYCFKCANVLAQQGETCWSCQHDYHIDLL